MRAGIPPVLIGTDGSGNLYGLERHVVFIHAGDHAEILGIVLLQLAADIFHQRLILEFSIKLLDILLSVDFDWAYYFVPNLLPLPGRSDY